jgi:predicted dienelactone hydrolase
MTTSLRPLPHAAPRAPMARALLAALLPALMMSSAVAQVGMTQLQAGDLPITMVYPTPEVATRRSFGPFEIEVAPDAQPTAGARRLIVLSHGTGGSAISDHALAATLARAGFVVAQPLHRGDNFRDLSRAGPASWATRPAEVGEVIDMLAGHPVWKARLRLDRVGVHGMSAGGVTALSLAGAQWRLLDLVRHCGANADADAGFCFNGLPTPAAQAERRAGFERARGVPEAFLPPDMKVVHGGRPAAGGDPRPDARVAAITLSVPLAAIFPSESLARIDVPVGVVRAGRDRWLVPQFHSDHVLRACERCSLIADLPGAGHMDLLAPWPAAVARDVAASQPVGGMPEPGFDPKAREQAFAAIAAFHSSRLDP